MWDQRSGATLAAPVSSLGGEPFFRAGQAHVVDPGLPGVRPFGPCVENHHSGTLIGAAQRTLVGDAGTILFHPNVTT